MRELREVTSKLYDTVEKLREDKDIEAAVEKLLLIKEKLNKIIKEST
ncbi:MAG: hypothetical protein ACLR9T_07895 [Thomasclavelia sp.]